MLNADRKSAWEFTNSNTGGIGVAFVAGNGGSIYLMSPKKELVQFNYFSVGVGASYSIKIPARFLQKPRPGELPMNAVLGPSELPNRGTLYMTKEFTGKELTSDDLRGTCVCLDLSAGLGVGVSLTAICLNVDVPMNTHTLVHQVLMPFAFGGPTAEMIDRELLGEKGGSIGKAVLFMVSMTAGAQAGAGLTGTIGALK